MYAPLVITGLHHMSNAIDLQLIADFQSTNLWPMIALSNIAQGSAVLAVIFMHRGNKKKNKFRFQRMISCYLGVTEPSDVWDQLKICLSICCGHDWFSNGGMFATLMGVRATSIGVGGLPGILSIVPQYYLPF